MNEVEQEIKDLDVTFGKLTRTNILDSEGSTESFEVNVVKGVVNRPIRKHYEIRSRVYNQAEEHKAYLSFSDRINNDLTMLDTSFKVEKSRLGVQLGYYYVAECYTRLEK